MRVFLPSVENPDAIHLTDQAGNPVRFAVKSAEARFQNNYSPINLPGQIPSVCAELEIVAEDVPACGYRVYRLGIGGESPLRPQTAELPACLENRYLRLHVSSEGKVSLLDKTGGELFEDLLTFTDECDIGHSYNFQSRRGESVTSGRLPGFRYRHFRAECGGSSARRMNSNLHADSISPRRNALRKM